MKTVGIYRTVFPIYSESFISSQVNAYSSYKPHFFCRKFIGDEKSFNFEIDYMVRQGWSLDAILFTVFGWSKDFELKIKGGNVRLMHAHFAQDAALIAFLSNKMGLPLVITCHGSDVTVENSVRLASGKVSDIKYLLGKASLFSLAACFIAVSDFIKKKMVASGIPAEKIIRHYIGVDTNYFTPLQSSIPQDDYYILSVARHVDVKGLDVLLRALQIVIGKVPRIRLVQIGDGQGTQELIDLAEQLEIRNSIDFLGSCTPDVVRRYLQRATLFVLSSRKTKDGAEEGFGIVLLEAAACGVPSVATRVGGIPEAVLDGQSGVLCEPDNPSDLAEKIMLLLTDEAFRQRIARQARQMACDKFDLKSQTRILEGIYDTLA